MLVDSRPTWRLDRPTLFTTETPFEMEWHCAFVPSMVWQKEHAHTSMSISQTTSATSPPIRPSTSPRYNQATSPSPQPHTSQPMPTFLHHALLACGFLTRLVPARVATADDMAAAVRWFPLAGLVVGGACWLPFALGLAASHPVIQAWLYVLINLWVTRGLHWDGVADLADAWGSSATGERFWDILKDSRIGAFGVMGLLLGFGGQYIGAHEIFISGRLGVLIAAPIVGRGACVILAALVPPGSRSTLGRLTCAGADRIAIGVAATCGMLALLLTTPAITTVTTIAICGAIVTALAHLARREDGINGDFMGACIAGCEGTVLLAASMG